MLHAFYTNRVKLADTKTENDIQLGTEGVPTITQRSRTL
jgi:hypothetical protein